MAVEAASAEVAEHAEALLADVLAAVAAVLQRPGLEFAASALAAAELAAAAGFAEPEGAEGAVAESAAAAVAFEEASETFAVEAGLASAGWVAAVDSGSPEA